MSPAERQSLRERMNGLTPAEREAVRMELFRATPEQRRELLRPGNEARAQPRNVRPSQRPPPRREMRPQRPPPPRRSPRG